MIKKWSHLNQIFIILWMQLQKQNITNLNDPTCYIDKIYKLLFADVYHQFGAAILPKLHVDLYKVKTSLIHQGKLVI